MDANSKRTLLILIGVLLLAALITFLFLHFQARKEHKEIEVQKIDNLNDQFAGLTNLAGEKVTLDFSNNKVKVVVFFASWCPTCWEQMQTINNLAGQYNNEPVDFIFLNRKESLTSVNSYLQSLDIEFNSNIQTIVDSTDNYFISVGGYDMPEVIIYDKNNNLTQHLRGKQTEENLSASLKETLNK